MWGRGEDGGCGEGWRMGDRRMWERVGRMKMKDVGKGFPPLLTPCYPYSPPVPTPSQLSPPSPNATPILPQSPPHHSSPPPLPQYYLYLHLTNTPPSPPPHHLSHHSP
ncbi:hypothetical protein Pmani_018804 [Petrolisthes manimaculis]|uniref:Uncharacterized protein n=1 Tax=Petrolisthes manimaculis TaxID=1843537 RepID=A0AAE1PKU8_9EUCA|nr:hypothetical protein Pmani_018804 [Petrolisthes manimaculis]